MKNSIFLLLFCFLLEIDGYTIPKITIKVTEPKGFEVSVPDDSDVTTMQIFLVFTKEVIEKSKVLEVNLVKNQKVWSYKNPSISLDVDDSFEYWLYVEVNGVGYVKTETIKVQDVYKKLCEPSITIVQGQNVCKDSLIFSEEFDDGLKKWNYETRFALDTQDAEYNLYEKRSETSFIRDNNFIIRPQVMTNVLDFDEQRIRKGEYKLGAACTPLISREDECERKAMYGLQIIPPVTSAFINTRNKFSFQYGRVEVRAKLPIGDWIYPQLLLQPADGSYNGSEHLKIAFIRSNEMLQEGGIQVGGTRLYGGAILSRDPLYTDTWLKQKLYTTHVGRSFHIFELIWKQNEIRLICDGVEYGKIAMNLKESATKLNVAEATNWNSANFLAPFDKELSLGIGVSVGGNTYFKDVLKNGASRKPKPWNNLDPRGESKFFTERLNWFQTWTSPSLEVDYIKIYSI